MYFKKLELVGFKSFADKTTIDFEAGVTAIVGPNGCGKSNVADAIRWVLGEQSAKSLRGGSMEDVIFNGSSAKEPLNLSEVSLTLANESRILAIDYDEVTITRRLYRSGDSEYLLNKNAVRLKDIHELLMGTGIGTENYSIIEQGKMDRILNSKPDERREIFEEAAGITKFKSKKKEALRKLELTDENLLRVGDILQEVKRQIGSVERQAKKAATYKVEFEKMKTLELAVASKEFVVFEDRRQQKQRALEALKVKEEEYLVSVQALEKQCALERVEVSKLEESLRAAQSQEMTAAGEIRRNQDRVLLNRERIGELMERKENLLKQMETARRRLQEFGGEFENLNKDFENLRREEEESRHFLNDGVEADFKAIEDFMSRAAADEEGKKKVLLDLVNRKSRAQTEMIRLQAELSSLEARLQRLENEKQSVLAELSALSPEAYLSTAQLLEAKVRQFKDSIMGVLRRIFEKQQSEPDAEEGARLDSEIKSFADDVLKLQSEDAERRSRIKHHEQLRKRAEEKLAVLARESQEIGAHRDALRGREAQLLSEMPSFEGEETALNDALASIQAEIKLRSKEKETLLVRLTEARTRQNHLTAKREKIEKDRNWVLESKANEEKQIVDGERQIEQTYGKKETLEKENEGLETETKRLSLGRDEILRNIESIRHQKDKRLALLGRLESEKNGRQQFLNSCRDEVHAAELEGANIGHEIDRLKERIFNAYQVDLVVQEDMAQSRAEAETALGQPAEIDVEQAKLDIQALKEKLNKMGPVNLVAIEEYDEMKQRFEFLTKQQADLVQAKEDLHKAIIKINRTTRELFVETFAKVQTHFSNYYRLLFNGGSAELVLLDQEDVLESGIEIVARPPGKKLQSISLLSGGEKALTAVALLFSLFKVKPSPFCVLDEIDAPLDETNVDRFCTVLKEFIVGSQFILITHNKRTMGLADALYGITMAQTGISKIVSVKFSDKKVGNRQEVLV